MTVIDLFQVWGLLHDLERILSIHPNPELAGKTQAYKECFKKIIEPFRNHLEDEDVFTPAHLSAEQERDLQAVLEFLGLEIPQAGTDKGQVISQTNPNRKGLAGGVIQPASPENLRIAKLFNQAYILRNFVTDYFRKEYKFVEMCTSLDATKLTTLIRSLDEKKENAFRSEEEFREVKKKIPGVLRALKKYKDLQNLLPLKVSDCFELAFYPQIQSPLLKNAPTSGLARAIELVFAKFSNESNDIVYVQPQVHDLAAAYLDINFVLNIYERIFDGQEHAFIQRSQDFILALPQKRIGQYQFISDAEKSLISARTQMDAKELEALFSFSTVDGYPPKVHTVGINELQVYCQKINDWAKRSAQDFNTAEHIRLVLREKIEPAETAAHQQLAAGASSRRAMLLTRVKMSLAYILEKQEYRNSSTPNDRDAIIENTIAAVCSEQAAHSENPAHRIDPIFLQDLVNPSARPFIRFLETALAQVPRNLADAKGDKKLVAKVLLKNKVIEILSPQANSQRSYRNENMSVNKLIVEIGFQKNNWELEEYIDDPVLKEFYLFCKRLAEYKASQSPEQLGHLETAFTTLFDSLNVCMTEAEKSYLNPNALLNLINGTCQATKHSFHHLLSERHRDQALRAHFAMREMVLAELARLGVSADQIAARNVASERNAAIKAWLMLLAELNGALIADPGPQHYRDPGYLTHLKAIVDDIAQRTQCVIQPFFLFTPTMLADDQTLQLQRTRWQLIQDKLSGANVPEHLIRERNSVAEQKSITALLRMYWSMMDSFTMPADSAAHYRHPDYPAHFMQTVDAQSREFDTPLQLEFLPDDETVKPFVDLRTSLNKEYGNLHILRKGNAVLKQYVDFVLVRGYYHAGQIECMRSFCMSDDYWREFCCFRDNKELSEFDPEEYYDENRRYAVFAMAETFLGEAACRRVMQIFIPLEQQVGKLASHEERNDFKNILKQFWQAFANLADGTDTTKPQDAQYFEQLVRLLQTATQPNNLQTQRGKTMQQRLLLDLGAAVAEPERKKASHHRPRSQQNSNRQELIEEHRSDSEEDSARVRKKVSKHKRNRKSTQTSASARRATIESANINMGVVPWEELVEVLDDEVKKPYSPFHLYYLNLLRTEISQIVMLRNIPITTPAEYIANFNYRHKVDYNYLLDEHYRGKKIAWLVATAIFVMALLLLMAWTVSLFITKGATFSLLPFMKPVLLSIGEAFSHVFLSIGVWEIIGVCVQGLLTAYAAGKLIGKSLLAWWPDITSSFRQPPATPLLVQIENGNHHGQEADDMESDLGSDASLSDELKTERAPIEAVEAADLELAQQPGRNLGLFCSAWQRMYRCCLPSSCIPQNTETQYQQLATISVPPQSFHSRSPSLPNEM